MTPLALIEAVATILWVYAGFALAEWIARVARMERRFHIPSTADLLGNLVPAMIMLVIVVLLGSLIGLPSVVVLIAVLFPAGLAFGAHMALNDLRSEADLPWEVARILLSFVVAGGVIYVRQIA